MGLVPPCEVIREHLSARLDGEEVAVGGVAQAVPAHLTACTECTNWWQQARLLARLTRTTAALPISGLSEEAMATIIGYAPAGAGRPVVPGAGRLPGSGRARVVGQLLRRALLAIGLAQLLLGLVQVSNFTVVGDHAHEVEIGAASPGHLWHESAAWNVAVGAALAWLAWRRARAATLLPVMTAFVAALTLLTINDALAGRVEFSRILSHGLVLTGYLLLLIMNLRWFRDQEPPAGWGGPAVPRSVSGVGHPDDGDGPLAAVRPLPVRIVLPRQVTVRQRDAA